MPRGKDTKVWNEDLVEACRAREAQCKQQGKARQHLWRDAASKIESVRADIYAFKNGRLVNFPKIKSKTADDVLRRVILGLEPVYPPGYVAAAAAANARGDGVTNPLLDDPYLKRIKVKSGAFAILMAMYVSQKDVMTKAEICRVGQPFCDEPMDANYLQGRPYAGWSSITTLTKHQLVLRSSSVVYRHAVGGLRTEGPHSFSLTSQGRKFVEALLQTRPEVKDILRLVTGSDAVVPPTPPPFTTAASSYSGAAAATASRGGVVGFGVGVGVPVTASAAPWTASTAASRRVTPLMSQDEDELRRWVETARVGQQRVFAGGKDRRGRLHDVCNELNAVLKLDGRHLVHESAGLGNARRLFVTVEAVAAADASWGPSARESGHSMYPPARKRLEPMFSGGTSVLGTAGFGSPPKRARPPATVAAAQAAMARQAIHESLQDHQRQQAACRVQLFADGDGRVAPSRSIKPSTAAERIAIDGGGSDDDSDSVEIIEISDVASVDERKPPAQQKAAGARSNARSKQAPRQPEIVLLDDSDDGDDAEDADDLPPPSCFAKGGPDAAAALARAKMDQDVCIVIDSRERDRNATPRAMRMAITQMLSRSGTLSTVWPRSWALPAVEEQTLPVGDFAFDLLDASGRRYRVPVHVERKRVSDLVQRSAKKDHWKQLQRMKSLGSVNGACVFLIEGDLRTAERFTAYGAQEMDMMVRNNFAIEDQDAAVRFLGRALLSYKSLRFIQTNAEVATYEAIAAVAMIASSLHSERKNACPALRDVDADRGKLLGFLNDAGIPRELSRCVADEFGSIEHLRSLYETLEDEDVCEGLLFPIVEDVVRDLNSTSTAYSWSSAIHKVFFSALKDTGAAKMLFDGSRNVVDDEARLLGLIHSGVEVNQAVDTILSDGDETEDDDHRRIVNLGIPKAMDHLFTWAVQDDAAFYRVYKLDSSMRYNPIPCVSIHTSSGDCASEKLLVFVLEGSEFVRRLSRGIDKSNGDYLAVARTVASGIAYDCVATNEAEGDTRVMLLHGLQPALDQAAKKPGFCLQSRAVAQMVLAQLMLAHNTVVLQAVRKTNDCEMMLQQLILSCYQFQLLTRKLANGTRQDT